MNFKEIYDLSVANVLIKDDQYLYRRICRQYSILFHTPLPQVYGLNPDDVLLNVLEHQNESIPDADDVMPIEELAERVINPNFEEDQEKELEEYISKLEQKSKKDNLKPKPIQKSNQYNLDEDLEESSDNAQESLNKSKK